MKKYTQKLFISLIFCFCFIGSTFADNNSFAKKLDVSVGQNNILTVKVIDSAGNIVSNYLGNIFINLPEINDLSWFSLPDDGIHIFTLNDKGVFTGEPICFKEKNKSYKISVESIDDSTVASSSIDFTNTMDYNDCIKNSTIKPSLPSTSVINNIDTTYNVTQLLLRKKQITQLMSGTTIDKQAELFYRIHYLTMYYIPLSNLGNLNDYLKNYIKNTYTATEITKWMIKTYLHQSDETAITVAIELNDIESPETEIGTKRASLKQLGSLGEKIYEYSIEYNDKLLNCLGNDYSDDKYQNPYRYCYDKIYNLGK